MGEDEVRIPMKMEVDSSDLQELRSEVEKTFHEIHDYESKRSTKKDQWNVKGVSDYETHVNSLLDKMRRLQDVFNAESQKTPFSDLKQVQASIGEQIKLNAQAQKDISSEYMRSLSYANQVKKSEEELVRIKKEQRNLQRQYRKDVKSVDPESKGATSRLKSLEKQYRLQQEQLKQQEMAVESRRNIDQKFADEAMQRSQTARSTYEEGQKTVTALREQASELGRIAKQEGYVQKFEEQRRATLEGINRQLRDAEEAITNYQYKAQKNTKQDKEETGYQTPREKALAKAQEQAARDVAKAEREKAKAARDAEKEAKAATNEQIAALKREEAAVKQNTSQYYYKLRSIKMLGNVFNQANSVVSKFGKNAANLATKALGAYLKLIPGVNTLRKAIDKTHTSQKRLNKEFKYTTKASTGFNFSLKDGLKTILKYGIGIRSLYVLFNKMRSAMIDGLGQLSTKYSEVNSQMSSIVSSMNQIKAAVTSVVQPLLNVLAPVLEKIAQLVSDIAYKVASFIAALTGQSYIFKATRLQTDYAASLDKTAKSAKDATKELGKYDKLNVIHQDKDSGGDGGVGDMGFEKVPVDSAMADLAEKFKKFLERLFAPIKKAWERAKAYLLTSFEYMCGQLKALWEDVARDFWRVWEEFKTEQLFYYLFLALGDIMQIIGTLAKKIREAWNANDNGYRILASIRDVLYEIVYHFREITAYTRDWVERELNLVPLFTAIADAMQNKVVPAVDRVLDLIVMIWNYGVLELLRDFINNNLPVLVEAVGYLIEGIGLIAKRIQMALETGTKVDGQIEYTRSRLQQILDKIEHFSHLVSESIRKMAKDFKDFADNLDFRPFFDSCIQFLEDIQPGFEALFGKYEIIDGKMEYTEGLVNKLWNETILPFWTYLIEDGGPKLIEILGQIFGEFDEETGMGIDWAQLSSELSTFIETLEPFFELAWETLLQIIKDLGKAFDDFVNSGTLGTLVDKFSDWVANADPEELAHKIEGLVKAFVEIKAALSLVSQVILPVVTGFMTIMNVINQQAMLTKIGELSTKIGALAGGGGAAAGGGGFAALASSIGPVILAIGIVVAVIATMVAAFGGLENTLAEIKERFDKAKEAISQFADNIGLSDTIDNLKEAFSNLGGSLESLRPIFELLLDVLGGIATVIIETVLGAVDGLILAFTGIIDIVSGVSDVIGGLIDIIVGLFTGDYAKADEGLSKMITGLGETFLGLGEVVAGIMNGIAEALAGFVDEALPGVAKGVEKFVTDVKNFFAWLRHQLIGDPIVYDIRDGVIEGFGEFVSETWDKINGWARDIKDKFGEMKKNISEKVDNIKTKVQTGFSEFKENAGSNVTEFKDGIVEKFTELKESMTGESQTATDDTTNDFITMKDTIVENINDSTLVASGTALITGFSNGVKTVWTTMLTTIKTDVDNLIKLFKTKFTNNTILSQGKQFITGFQSGIKNIWTTMLSDVKSKITGLINEFKNKLQRSTLISVGKDLIEGLKEGLLSSLRSALTAIKTICQEIVTTVRQAFDSHSPSRVFMSIGKDLMDGLVIGVDNNTDEITDVFESVVPDDSMTDNFYNDFIDGLANMKRDAVSIVSSMVDEIETLMSSLSYANQMNSIYTQLNKINSIRIPNIVSGQTLPSNVDFKQNSKQEVDFSKLPNIIREAMLDALSEADFSSNNQPIMLQLDSRTVAEAVWDEEEKRYKQRGDYSPLYR